MVISGWTIYAHPLFLDQLEELIVEVEALRAKAPQGYVGKNASKRLAAITSLMLKDIPQGPKRQGVPTGIHARRCTSPLATSQVLSAVPVVLPVSHPLTADCLGLGQPHSLW